MAYYFGFTWVRETVSQPRYNVILSHVFNSEVNGGVVFVDSSDFRRGTYGIVPTCSATQADRVMNTRYNAEVRRIRSDTDRIVNRYRASGLVEEDFYVFAIVYRTGRADRGVATFTGGPTKSR